MRLAVLKERRASETRVAATPETVKRLIALGLTVAIEAGAGAQAAIPDQEFAAAGAEIAPDAADSPGRCRDRVRRADAAARAADADPARRPAGLHRQRLRRTRAGARRWRQAGIDCAAMELLPRITRAQAMDVLSSQANLAGYRAVIEAAGAFQRGFPMMMTAAGTVPPARVFVIGAGVAGLQAIATARRLGAIVSATDVRPAAKEEIKSLGASFVGVEDEETAGQTGAYAREMSEAFRQKQAELMAATIAKNDLVICTALVHGPPGAGHRDRSRWWTSMRPGSVIVDLAADAGGNCAATVPGERITTRERRHDPRLSQLAGPHPGRRLLALCAQPADLPDHVLGQGGEGAEAAGGRRHREGRHADPRRRRRASAASCPRKPPEPRRRRR